MPCAIDHEHIIRVLVKSLFTFAVDHRAHRRVVTLRQLLLIPPLLGAVRLKSVDKTLIRLPGVEMTGEILLVAIDNTSEPGAAFYEHKKRTPVSLILELLGESLKLWNKLSIES